MTESKQYKFCSLHTFVKKHNKPLFNILEDMCAVGLFRPKYPVTFINPSDKLVKKLAAMVDDGDTDVAFEHLQKLFIYGQHDELSGELVSYNNKKIVSDLSKLKRNKDFVSWERRKGTCVFDSGAEFPEEGEAATRPKTDRKPTKRVKGSAEDCDSEKMQATKEIFVDTKYESFKNLQHAVAYHINSLLGFVKKMDMSAYEKAKTVLDPNMVVCWYILVQPSSDKAGYIPQNVFSEWFKHRNAGIHSVELLKQAFASNEYDNDKLAKIGKVRKEIMDTDGFENLKNAVMRSYEGKHRKLLEDEIRFRYSDEEDFSSFEISELNVINWEEPEHSLVLFRQTQKNCLFKASIHKLIKEFVASNAFHYTMFNANIHEKFSKAIHGAGSGKRMIKILGGSARDAINNISGSDEGEIKLMLTSLNEDQMKALKKMLEDM